MHKRRATSIDLWPVPHGDQREQVEALGNDRFAELLAQHDVKLSMTTRYDLGPEKLADEIAFVQKFGGSLIVTGSHGRGDGSLKDHVRPPLGRQSCRERRRASSRTARTHRWWR